MALNTSQSSHLEKLALKGLKCNFSNLAVPRLLYICADFILSNFVTTSWYMRCRDHQRTWCDGTSDSGRCKTTHIAKPVVGHFARPTTVNHYVVTGQMSVALNARLMYISHSLHSKHAVQHCRTVKWPIVAKKQHVCTNPILVGAIQAYRLP